MKKAVFLIFLIVSTLTNAQVANRLLRGNNTLIDTLNIGIVTVTTNPPGSLPADLYSVNKNLLKWNTTQIRGFKDSITNIIDSYGFITQEVDPIFVSDSALYLRKLQASILYQPIGDYLIPFDTIGKWKPINWQPDLSNYYTKVGVDTLIPTKTSELVNDNGFITTEVDPIFTSSVAYSITNTDKTNWNTAYGWGNHAGLYPTYNGTGAMGTWGISVSGNANTVTNGLYSTSIYNNPIWLNTLNWSKITNTPTTLSGYGITNGVDITTFNSALATKFNNPLGTTSQYIRGDGSIAVFPTIPLAQVNSDWNAVSGVSQILNKPTLFSGSYNDLTSKPDLSIYYLNSNPSGFVSNLSTFTTTNLSEGTNLYFTNTRARSAISQGTGITYNSSTGVISNSAPDQTVTISQGAGIQVTGTYPNFTITNTSSTPTINNSVTRALNSSYTISATKLVEVNYSITCSVTNPLLAGVSTAVAYLEYSTNGGTSWIIVNQTGNTSGVGLAVAVAITNTQTTTLSGMIPPNALVRIRTTTSGTASVTYVIGQETIY